MEIMTGYTGKPHVSAEQFRSFLVSLFGDGSYIFPIKDQLEYVLESSNLLTVKSGMMIHHGNISHVEKEIGEQITIANGTQGMKRIDLIVNRYSKDETTAVETNSLVYIQGTAATSDPVAPEYTVGNLLNGDIVDDCPILKIELDGLNITQITPLLPVLANMNQRIEDSKTEAVYVVETGHTSFKHWIKYSDGTMEQWGSLPHPLVNLVSADGYLRYGEKMSITFSEKFVAEPVVQVTLLHAKAAVFATLEAITTSGFTYWPYGTKQASLVNVETLWHASGRWK